MKLYKPQKMFVEKGAKDFPASGKILSQLPDVPVEEIEDSRSLIQALRKKPDPIGEGKRALLLARDQGRAFKPFPNADGLVSCDFYSLHLVEGCDLDCSYCILQAYLTNPILTVYVNLDEILRNLETFLKARPRELFRIGTGQLADSLSLDHLTAHTEYLVPFFARQSNAVLELKTKSANIARLENLDPAGRTIVSWSVNTKRIQQEEEHKCATLEERIRAAKQCASWGYGIGFHFDPVIDYEGCLKEYEELIEEIFSNVSPRDVTWLSLGTLRFMPKLKSIMESRFPKSPLPYGEWVRGVDGKMRYFKGRRIEIYRRLVRRLHREAPRVPVYLCMETEEVWREVFGRDSNPLAMVQRLDRAIRHCRASAPRPRPAEKSDKPTF